MEKSIKLPETVEHWDIDKLKPYENNARTHSFQQILEIAASIVEFGFTNPILIDPDGGIFAGHGRFEAARHLEMKKVPVIILAGLSEIQKRAYILADNKLALNAGWNETLLKQELLALDAAEFDLKAIGFSDKELQEIVIPIEERESIEKKGSKEFSQDEFSEFEHSCPKCGFEFNSPEEE